MVEFTEKIVRKKPKKNVFSVSIIKMLLCVEKMTRLSFGRKYVMFISYVKNYDNLT